MPFRSILSCKAERSSSTSATSSLVADDAATAADESSMFQSWYVLQVYYNALWYHFVFDRVVLKNVWRREDDSVSLAGYVSSSSQAELIVLSCHIGSRNKITVILNRLFGIASFINT